MALETRSSGVLSFGTFEVDLRSGELRKQGKRIKLQEQPFQVLTVLLQRPGEVVTREELRNKNWSPDTFVDFDNSLNTAINKLREALGDSADNPRFIETLPRRGYRFLATVTGDQTRKAPSLAIKWWVGVATAVVILAGAVEGGFLWRSRLPRQLTDKDTIVLGDFANWTGDPVFDATLREGLSVQLQQSQFLSLVSEEGVQQTLRRMGQPANARLTPQVTREVCQRTSSTTALEGSIALIGTRYNLILKAVNCVNGDLLVGAQAQASDKTHVLDALSKAASEMRRRLGESLSSVQKYNTPLEQATTGSLEALQAYTLGRKALYVNYDPAGSLPFLHRAIQLDPNFAMAYLLLGDAHAGIGKTVLAGEDLRKAFELRAGLSELEKLLIEGQYYNQSGDLLKARRSYVASVQLYPREPNFHLNLEFISNVLGQYEAGHKEALESFRLEPYNSYFCRQLVHSYLFLDRGEDAAAAAKEAHAKGVDALLIDVLYEIAFYRNDAAEMARQLARAEGKPGDEELVFAKGADTAAYFGHLEEARELSRRAADSAERAGEEETGGAAGIYAVSALREALFGDAEESRQKATLAKRYSAERDALSNLAGQNNYGLALALAYAGDLGRAQAFVDDLNKRFPEDTVMQFNYLPTLRARLALTQGNPREALETLRTAAPYELGLPAFGFYNWPNLYPVYVRGEAYLAARQGREAAAEFQKILDHRGIVLNEPIGALAHLQLGRAYAMAGDTAKARAAYQDFLTLWKEADPDIPILKQAKAEYAKLQ